MARPVDGGALLRPRGLALLALGALACRSGPPAEPLTALERASAHRLGTFEACARLPEGAERGSCEALAAHARASQGDVEGAWRSCQGMPAGPWRDECHFLVTDAAAVVGEEARAWCQSAGAWRLQCVGHALSRDAQAVLSATPRGREDEAMQALVALTARYVGPQQAAPRAHRLLVDHLALRDAERDFHPGVCGTAPREACRDVYIERVRRGALQGEPWRAACGRRVPVERAVQTGQPAWEPEMDAVAAEAWSVLCSR